MFRIASPLAGELPTPTITSETSDLGVLNKTPWKGHRVSVQRDGRAGGCSLCQTEEGTNHSPLCWVLVQSSGLWAIPGRPSEN